MRMNAKGYETIIVDKRRRGTIPKRVWKWMKRRAAIEPTIGHLKVEHRLERNLLHLLRSLFTPASRDQFLAVMS
ncbi:MAG: hypothetical protein H2172_17760 [Opitutus sp.]|nr:hypothetical protein [Opitutus sp.]MCS6275063.1 hypothetical protein [Opitutus sp.]MCS6278259.1 hypothetical protein [Opitutus sp.]MCS6299369.1 hypothetical protein [Opitutus sp.]